MRSNKTKSINHNNFNIYSMDREKKESESEKKTQKVGGERRKNKNPSS